MEENKDNDIIKKNVPIAYYYQIQLDILKNIEKGVWGKGSFIPSERELANKYKVSRVTVRHALANLSVEGILEKMKGKGILVSDRDGKQRMLNRLIGFYQYLEEKGYKIISKIISNSEILPDSFIRSVLDLKEDEKVYKIERLRIVNDKPLYYSIIYVSKDMYPDLLNNDLIHLSFYNILRDKYGIEIFRAKRSLYARPAPRSIAKLMDISEGDPMQVYENITYMKNDKPIEYSINYGRSDNFSFEIEVTSKEIVNLGNSAKV